MIQLNVPPYKTRDYLKRICTILYISGAQNYWFEELKLPSALKLFHVFYMNMVTVASVILILLQWGVYFSNQKMTVKQSFDSKVFALGHPLAFIALIITEKNRRHVRNLMKRLVVNIMEIYNDKLVEKDMIANSKLIMKYATFMIIMTVFLYGMDGYIQVRKGLSFVTIVTAWPNVEDTSTLASISRGIIFMVWSFLFTRLASVFILVLPVSVCLSYQYKNLRSYFENLNDIFEEHCSEEEKDVKYDKAFKVGIQLHLEIMECVKQLQTQFNPLYGGQIIIKSMSLMALLASLANAERTPSHVITTLMAASYSLVSLGLVICSAGNITVAAESLPSAMFNSGWQKCTKKSSARLRKMVVIAIMMSQRPVVMKCGSIALSYRSYVTIVKSCYSGFSVLY